MIKRWGTWRPPLWLVAILLGATLALGTGVGYVRGAANNGECTESAEVCAKFDNFWTVWNIAEKDFLDPKAVEPDKMIAGAINGMLDTLNDQGHTRYDTAEQYQQEIEQQSGEYQGIGAYVNQEGDLIVIVAPIEGSPAEAAGVEAGDIIVSVDGASTEGKTSAEVAQLIRGAPGTDVTLTLRHLDQEAPVDITITRGEIKVPAVTWAMLPAKTAHIKLSQFSEDATTELKRALAEAKEQGAEKLVLDLRNNPGGLLEQAIGVSSQFLPKGDVVLRVRDRDGEEDVRTANEANPETELPMVVLINSGSASSSEIFAGALQDHKRATIVGLDTVGLGTVISPRELDDGSAVYIGIAEWLTPDGRQLRHQGVAPDIKVTLEGDALALTPSAARKLSEDEILRTDDAQLKRALEVLGVPVVAEGPAGIAVR